jgi:hypothetical protein
VTQLIKAGDLDVVTGAVVTAVDRDLITLRMGFDDDLKPGVPVTLTTARYVVKGTALSVSVEQP